MPRYIIKVAGKYMEYSTIVDHVVSMPMTLEELKSWYGELHGTHGLLELEERLTRVEAKGTSSMQDEDVRNTLRCNRMADKATPYTEDGETYDSWEMSFEEFEQHVRDLTGPFAEE